MLFLSLWPCTNRTCQPDIFPYKFSLGRGNACLNHLLASLAPKGLREMVREGYANRSFNLCHVERRGSTKCWPTENQLVPEVCFKREIHVSRAGLRQATWLKRHLGKDWISQKYSQTDSSESVKNEENMSFAAWVNIIREDQRHCTCKSWFVIKGSCDATKVNGRIWKLAEQNCFNEYG